MVVPTTRRDMTTPHPTSPSLTARANSPLLAAKKRTILGKLKQRFHLDLERKLIKIKKIVLGNVMPLSTICLPRSLACNAVRKP